MSSKSKSNRNPNPKTSGRLAIPPGRSIVIDLMALHRKFPTVTHAKKMNLQSLAISRVDAAQQISWSMLFIKGYSRISQEFSELRQTFMTFPWQHIYEHSECVANVAIQRDYQGDEWLFFAPFRNPDQFSLTELQEALDYYRKKPVEMVFKTQLRFAHLPLFIRRWLWWFRLHLSGPKRVKRLGTFGLTTLAGQGVTIVDPRAPSTSVLTYGPLDSNGNCQVSIAYDHRVMDGGKIAAILNRLEDVLNQEIRTELELLEEICQPTVEPTEASVAGSNP